MYSINLCVNIQCCVRKQFELLRFTLDQISVYRSIYTMQAINGSFLCRSSYFSTYTRKYHRFVVIFDVSNFLTNLKNVVLVPIERVLLKSTPNSNSISVISETTQRFTCDTKQPTARYQWYKGTTNITSSDDGGVKLVTFNKTDNGSELKCRGWNRVTKGPYPEGAIAINVLCKCDKHLNVKVVQRTSY